MHSFCSFFIVVVTVTTITVVLNKVNDSCLKFLIFFILVLSDPLLGIPDFTQKYHDILCLSSNMCMFFFRLQTLQISSMCNVYDDPTYSVLSTHPFSQIVSAGCAVLNQEVWSLGAGVTVKYLTAPSI